MHQAESRSSPKRKPRLVDTSTSRRDPDTCLGRLPKAAGQFARRICTARGSVVGWANLAAALDGEKPA